MKTNVVVVIYLGERLASSTVLIKTTQTAHHGLLNRAFLLHIATLGPEQKGPCLLSHPHPCLLQGVQPLGSETPGPVPVSSSGPFSWVWPESLLSTPLD